LFRPKPVRSNARRVFASNVSDIAARLLVGNNEDQDQPVRRGPNRLLSCFDHVQQRRGYRVIICKEFDRAAAGLGRIGNFLQNIDSGDSKRPLGSHSRGYFIRKAVKSLTMPGEKLDRLTSKCHVFGHVSLLAPARFAGDAANANIVRRSIAARITSHTRRDV
jgi:hypothetical protein